MSVHRASTFLLSLTMVGLGLALIVVTLVRGSGALGIVLGPMFIAAGAGRLWALRIRGGTRATPEPEED